MQRAPRICERKLTGACVCAFVCLCAHRYLLSKSSINFAMDVDYMIQDLFDYVR